jgi:hypothetical protein
MQHCDIFLLVGLLVLVVIVAHVFACKRSSKHAAMDYVGGATDAYTHRLLPAGRPPHTHEATLSSRGDGDSTVDLGHSHRVRNYDVKPAGLDAHVHDITQYIV